MEVPWGRLCKASMSEDAHALGRYFLEHFDPLGCNPAALRCLCRKTAPSTLNPVGKT